MEDLHDLECHIKEIDQKLGIHSKYNPLTPERLKKEPTLIED
jgi:hypothetical protein